MSLIRKIKIESEIIIYNVHHSFHHVTKLIASVNLSPFRVMNVPPPMFAFSVQLSNPASCVSFLPNNGGNDFVVLEADQQITLFEWSGALERPIKAPTCVGSIQYVQIIY